MPLYEYECRKCEHVFEELVFGDEPVVCPKCQGTLTKVIYPTGVIFKGSGFYSTDYKTSEKSSGNGSTPSSDKPETKSDPKPESKSESSD